MRMASRTSTRLSSGRSAMTDVTFQGTPVAKLDIQRSTDELRDGSKETTTTLELTFEDGKKAWLAVGRV